MYLLFARRGIEAMKIAVVSQVYKKGGGGAISTYLLVSALRDLGHEVKVMQTLEDISPDIVLHQNIKGLVKTQKICERRNIPLIVTINSNITCPTSAHITNETKYGVPCLNCSLLKCVSCHIWNKREKEYTKTKRVLSIFESFAKYVLRNLRIKTLNKVDKIVCVSPSLRERLASAGVDKSKIEVIIQPVDKSFFNDPGVRHFEEKVALFAGAISWIKGAHLAAEAISKLNDIKLVYVGGAGDRMRKIIRSFLKERAIFVGKIPYERMPEYYYSAHVTLFPSIWFDPHGRVWTESCACGTPVVAFKGRGGASDYLKHEETALLSDYDVDEYAEQIKRLFEDEALYKKISRNAREYAKKNFSADVVAKKYEKIFEEVLERK